MALGENYVRTIIGRSIAVLLLAIGLSLFLAENPKPYIYGFLFGGSITILGFKLIEQNVKKLVNMSANGAKMYMMTNYFVRVAIYGIVLVVAAKADYISFLTAAISLFIVKLVIVSDALFDSIKDKSSKQ